MVNNEETDNADITAAADDDTTEEPDPAQHIKPVADATKEPEPNNEPDVEGREEEIMETDIEADMNEQYGKRTAAYNLRPCKPRDYGHIHAALEHTFMTA
jgi:hypothetical protein